MTDAPEFPPPQLLRVHVHEMLERQHGPGRERYQFFSRVRLFSQHARGPVVVVAVLWGGWRPSHRFRGISEFGPPPHPAVDVDEPPFHILCSHLQARIPFETAAYFFFLFLLCQSHGGVPVVNFLQPFHHQIGQIVPLLIFRGGIDHERNKFAHDQGGRGRANISRGRGDVDERPGCCRDVLRLRRHGPPVLEEVRSDFGSREHVHCSGILVTVEITAYYESGRGGIRFSAFSCELDGTLYAAQNLAQPPRALSSARLQVTVDDVPTLFDGFFCRFSFCSPSLLAIVIRPAFVGGPYRILFEFRIGNVKGIVDSIHHSEGSQQGPIAVDDPAVD
mmetsp:Transcript_35661/g.70163  ORF Transcript_35661/g.70163 Transcript_35661/m.70163 type:complete len:334 (-) Transcript_35661:270-1271(-)